MAKVSYPPKPWKDKQIAFLLPDLRFVYNASLKKWVPVTPGYTKEEDIAETFGTVAVKEINQRLDHVDSDIELGGRIWKTINRPSAPSKHDVWIDPNLRVFTYFEESDTWIEINYLVKLR